MSAWPRLLRLIAPFRWWIALAVLLSFATVGSSVGLAAMSAYLISRAALVNAVADLSLAITFVRLFAITRAVFRYLERYITHRTTFRILAHLRVWFFAAVEPLAPARLSADRSGDLLARIMADIETLENFYVRAVVPPMAALLVTGLACVILGLFDIRLALALLLFLLLTGVALPLTVRRLSSEPGEALIAGRAALNAALVDEIQGIGDALLLGQAEAIHQRTMRLTEELIRVQGQAARLRGLGNGLAALFTGLAGLTVLWLAVPLVSGGQIEGVYLALLPLTAIAAFEAVQPLSQAWQVLEESRAAARRLFELIDRPAEVLDPPEPVGPPTTFGLDVRGLSFRYAPDEPAVLHDLILSVAPGECVGLAGPNGSGKSTLINLLMRFWEYEEGTIYLGGRELRALSAEETRRLIAVVPQQTHLFNSTMRDNLRLANPEASDAELEAACRIAQIHDFIAGLPAGYSTLVGENGLLLSGGERQRLAIARAILKNAPVLILDEATAQLDPVTEREVLAGLGEYMAGRTTIVIAHRRAALAHCRRIITLSGEHTPSTTG